MVSFSTKTGWYQKKRPGYLFRSKDAAKSGKKALVRRLVNPLTAGRDKPVREFRALLDEFGQFSPIFAESMQAYRDRGGRLAAQSPQPGRVLKPAFGSVPNRKHIPAIVVSNSDPLLRFGADIYNFLPVFLRLPEPLVNDAQEGIDYTVSFDDFITQASLASQFRMSVSATWNLEFLRELGSHPDFGMAILSQLGLVTWEDLLYFSALRSGGLSGVNSFVDSLTPENQLSGRRQFYTQIYQTARRSLGITGTRPFNYLKFLDRVEARPLGKEGLAAAPNFLDQQTDALLQRETNVETLVQQIGVNQVEANALKNMLGRKVQSNNDVMVLWHQLIKTVPELERLIPWQNINWDSVTVNRLSPDMLGGSAQPPVLSGDPNGYAVFGLGKILDINPNIIVKSGLTFAELINDLISTFLKHFSIYDAAVDLQERRDLGRQLGSFYPFAQDLRLNYAYETIWCGYVVDVIQRKLNASGIELPGVRDQEIVRSLRKHGFVKTVVLFLKKSKTNTNITNGSMLIASELLMS